MKKRIIAAFVSIVIIALSVLTVLSGCSGEEGVKEVEDRKAFFSEIMGYYYFANLGYLPIYIDDDGTVYVSNYTSFDTFSQLKGSFKTIYQDSEYIYHTEISQLKKSFQILKNNYLFATDQWPTLSSYYEYPEYYFPDLPQIRNDTIYIYAPGMLINDIPKSINYKSYDEFDMDSDDKLDNYLLYSYTEKEPIIPYNNYFEGNSIEAGFWIDYTSNDSKADVYTFKKSKVEVTSWDYSEKTHNTEMSAPKKDEPLYYTTYESSVLVIYKNDITVIINTTKDKDKLKCIVKDSDKPEDKIFYLYHYDKVPDKEEMKNDAEKAKVAFSDEDK